MKKKMSIKTIKVSGKGQIAIPREIQRDFGISKGDEFILIAKDNKILLEKTENMIDQFDKEIEMQAWRNASLSSLKKIWDNEEDDIWEEYLK
jgi:AbrB family looped-hinge helix DNA binding protein